MSNPTNEWLLKFEEVKNVLVPASDYREYFTLKNIDGKRIHTIPIGNLEFPTGEVIVCDPLVYLDREINPRFQKVPTGSYPADIAVVEVEENHYRYAVLRVKFSENPVVRFEEALTGEEDIDDIKEGDFFGFHVDAGLATVVDAKTRDAYCDFAEKWNKENPDGNLYDDLFSDLFAENYEKHPQYQREGGDWFVFNIPNTSLNVPMVQSGFGDGTYPVYFGMDHGGKAAWLVVEFIDIKAAFSLETDGE